MKEFEEYLKRIGKSENTALTYCRNIRMYFSWCRDSFGSEPNVKAKLFCPEIAGLFCRIAGLFCHDSRANLSLKPVCFGIAIS